jgi:hypothetical protein
MEWIKKKRGGRTELGSLEKFKSSWHALYKGCSQGLVLLVMAFSGINADSIFQGFVD